jgi:hypothetical protein
LLCGPTYVAMLIIAINSINSYAWPLADDLILFSYHADLVGICSVLTSHNGFLLSMASPMLHKMLFRDFREGVGRRLELEDVDGGLFGDVLDLWCGKEVCGDKELAEVMMMASVADRLQMVEVVTALEDAIMGEMRVGTCAEVLESVRAVASGGGCVGDGSGQI